MRFFAIGVRGAVALGTALALGLFVHEGFHLLQALEAGVEPAELYLTLNPLLDPAKCQGRFACTTPFPGYAPGKFLMGEGYPQTIHGIIIGEVWMGLLPWVMRGSAASHGTLDTAPRPTRNGVTVVDS